MTLPGDGPEPTPAPAPADELPSAGWWRRLLATLVDMLVYCALAALVAAPLLQGLRLPRSEPELESLLERVAHPEWRARAASVVGLWMGLWWGYFALGWGLAGATPGKWLLGLRVVDHRQRCPIGLARSLLRLVAYSVSSVTLCWGHLLILLRRDRRALHDLLAGTRVVRWKGGPRRPRS